ncbi:MAG TPA: hypothetical protein VNA04_13080 [Thermoanaerobaculia bacterium]|nr:hypothetical protein [Thermoanaerobaculia bacterium]
MTRRPWLLLLVPWLMGCADSPPAPPARDAIATGDLEELEAHLLPVDNASSDGSFAAFRNRLLDIVRREDRDALLSALDPGLRVSFGPGGRRQDFIAAHGRSRTMRSPSSQSPPTTRRFARNLPAMPPLSRRSPGTS